MRHLPSLLLALALPLLSAAAHAQAPADSVDGFLSTRDGTLIHYRVRGTGRPVVLLHGFMGTAASWSGAPVYRRLLQAGFRVVTLDLRGNGASDHPHRLEAYQNDAEARDVMELASHLRLGRYCAVGYSRGSIITARLLVLDPRLRCAVLGGMGADFTDPRWPRRERFYRALLGDTVPELAAMVRRVEETGLDRLALAYQQGAQPSTSPAELARVRRPVLVVSGDRDRDNGSAQELARLIPRATLATVPGDHGGAMRTEELAAAVVEFVRGH